MECQSLSYRVGSLDYGTLLVEFPKGYGDTVDDEHCVSSVDSWSVGEDHTGLDDMLEACVMDLKGS